MSALLSMVVSLAPRGSGRFEGGDAVQGWILDQVRRDDPGLAAALHANQELKPYTVSPLRLDDQRGMGEVRLTALGEQIASGLLRSLRRAGADVAVGTTLWRVQDDAVARQQHQWANTTSAVALFDRAKRATDRDATLVFHSPTAFGGYDDGLGLFPEPRLVFESLLKRWRSLDARPPAPLPEGDWTRHIQVRAHELKTVAPAGPHRHVRTGFVGICCYRVERQAPPSVALWLRACAALALYSGVGMGTARGMGQVTGEWGEA